MMGKLSSSKEESFKEVCPPYPCLKMGVTGTVYLMTSQSAGTVVFTVKGGELMGKFRCQLSANSMIPFNGAITINQE